MREEIKKLEVRASVLEPTAQDRDELVKQATEYAHEFIDNLSTLPTYVADNSGLKRLDRTAAVGSRQSFKDILDVLSTTVDHIGINPAGGGHLGYVPGGGIYASAIGDYMAAVFNRYAGLYYASPGSVKLENKLLKWVCDMVGYPEEALGNITSGGSIANLIALTTARDKMKIKPAVIEKSVIYYSQQTHHCVFKAIRIAGLAECQTRKIVLDHHYRMDPRDLRRQVGLDKDEGLRPFFIAASAGSTDTGACDDIDQIATIARHNNIWLHVDAAYGGFFILVDELKKRFEGIDKADSIVLDPHKGLFLPYGIGIVIVRNGKALFESYHAKANYLQDAFGNEEEPSSCDLSPELTKHFRGLRMWIPFQLYGLEPFRAALKEKWLLAIYFYDEVQKLGFEVGPKPDLSICMYRYVPDGRDANEFNARLTSAILEDGRIFISTTNIDDIFWMRVAVVCFRTHLKTIDQFLNILKEKLNILLEC